MGGEPRRAETDERDVMTEPDPTAVLAALPDPVMVVSATGDLLWANRRAEQEFGIDVATARRLGPTHILHPDDVVTALSSLISVQRKDVGTLVEVRLWDARGRWTRYEVRGWSGVDDPRVGGVVCVLRRVEDRGGWSVSGGDTARLAAVLEWSPGLTMLLAADGTVIAANRALSNHLGIDLESVIGRPLRDLVVEEHAAAVSQVMRMVCARGGASRAFEATFRSGPTRRPTPFGLTAVNLLDDDHVRAVVVSGVDVAALVETRAELTYRATHDPLTGLANRTLVLETLDRALAEGAASHRAVGLVYLDLDGFKATNDTWGHAIGDEVLVGLSARLRAAVQPTDVAGRLGGDELVVVLSRDARDQIDQAVAELRAALRDPVITAAGAIEAPVSVGVALAGPDDRADDLLSAADLAMYEAKKRTRR